jgi:hypothetical protein
MDRLKPSFALLITSNVRRFDSLDPRLNKAEVFSLDTGNDTIGLSNLSLNIKANLFS